MTSECVKQATPQGFDPFNCPKCGSHDYGLFAGSCLPCPHCLIAEKNALERSLREREEQLRAAEKERDELKKDAARYRWLRKQQWYEAAICVVAHPKEAINLGSYCPALDLLDEAIDTASAALDAAAHTREGE